MKTIEQIKEFLQNELTDSELFVIYSKYNEDNWDEQIYDMDDFDYVMANYTPIDIAKCIFYGDFCPNHNYFIFDGCANLKSFDYMDEEINFNDIAQYIYDNEDDLDNQKLFDFLDLDNEEE